MASSNVEIAQALAVACLNQPDFVKTLVSTSNISKPAAARDAKLLGETVGEFYQAIYKAVVEAYKPGSPSTVEHY